jgi:hypothetical protein
MTTTGGALILAGLKLSDNWSDAVVIHELEHVRLDRAGAASAHAPLMSDLWINEELHTHELERKVLNHATNGQYARQLRQIVNSKARIISLAMLHNSVTVDDLQGLDRLFAPASELEAGLRASQFLFDLGEIWLQSRYLGQELQQLRVKNYQLIITT